MCSWGIPIVYVKMKIKIKVKEVKTQLILLDVNERHVSAYLAIIRLQSFTRLSILWRMLRSHHLARTYIWNINSVWVGTAVSWGGGYLSWALSLLVLGGGGSRWRVRRSECLTSARDSMPFFSERIYRFLDTWSVKGFGLFSQKYWSYFELPTT